MLKGQNFPEALPPEPLPGPCHEPLVELTAPWNLPPAIYNIRKLNLWSKTDISETAWVNACNYFLKKYLSAIIII